MEDTRKKSQTKRPETPDDIYDGDHSDTDPNYVTESENESDSEGGDSEGEVHEEGLEEITSAGLELLKKQAEPLDTQMEAKNEESPEASLENIVYDQWFNKILNKTPIETDVEELNKVVKILLGARFNVIEPKLRTILPHLLIIFVKSWPGWKSVESYNNGTIDQNSYRDKFKEYLKIKFNVNIPILYNTALKEILQDNENELNNSKYNGKPLTEYALKITCPPEMLSTIIFTNTGDDVVLKQHLGKHWVGLDTAQLLNWPNIRVIFISEDLFFLRHQSIDYERYLNFVPAEYKTNNEIVESAEMISSRKVRHCFTHRLLAAYIKEYLEVLKTHTKLPFDKIEEVSTILEQFLKDIDCMKIESQRTIATNTKILFRLSPVSYIRNKKLVNQNSIETRIGYCEVLTPKVELLLRHFRAIMNAKTGSFDLKEQVLLSPQFSLIPKIYYKCTFCNRDFVDHTSKRDILFHLFFEHRMEQPLRCVKCKQHFDVTDLAKARWQHDCNTIVKAETKNEIIEIVDNSVHVID